MPKGGTQTSLVGMVQSLMAPFRRPTPGKGAPIYSYAYSQGGANGARPANGDITQFAPVFQPSGGLFAPGYPLVPPDYERTRRYNFPVGLNYIYTPRSFEPIGFAELKALASDDITRLCIETRKDQVEKLGWQIKPRNEKDVAANSEKRIQQMTEFWSFPDGITPFATWLRALMDQVLTTDAPAIEPRLNRGGDIIGLDVIDGATIKVLIDDTGRRPRPPAPAYQQIIHGRPWVLLEDGTRTNTEEGEVYGEFTDQQLIYFPRNVRADHLYGFSPVEQIVLTINTSIRRGVMQLQHFTIGNVPAGLVGTPATWTTEQIARYQDWFDTRLSGNTGERTKLLFGPEGAKYQPIKEPPLKDDYDEWRARVICFAFSLPPTAFTRQVNRATAETSQEAALEEGLAPLMSWVKRLVDQVIQRRMGHPDLEFAWSDVKPIDPTDQANMLVSLAGAGLNTINEARDQLGLDPVQGGDEILFKTATGPITLDAVLNPPEPVLPTAPGQPGQNPGAAPGGKKPPPKPGQKQQGNSAKPRASAARNGSKSPPAGGKKKPTATAKPGQKPEGGAEAAGKPNGKGRGVGKVAADPLSQAAGEPPQHGAARGDQDPLADEVRAFLRRARAGGGEATGEGDGTRGLAAALDPPPPWRVITGIVAKASGTISQDEADYVAHPVDGEQCDGCTMFEPPDGCSYVRGEISPTGHCRFFEDAAEKAVGHVDPKNAEPVGFPLADPIDQADVLHTAFQIIRDGAAAYRERTIPLDQCRAMQPVVDSERVARSEEIYEDGEEPDLIPLVLERDGLFCVLAGHHHVEGAIDAGKTELRVQELYRKD